MSDLLRAQARQRLNQFGSLVILALAPALISFGWRAMLVMVGIVISRAVAAGFLQEPHTHLRRGPGVLPIDSLLVCALMPAELAAGMRWPLIPAAGITLALLQRFRSAIPNLPFDAALITALALHGAMLIGGEDLRPEAALQRHTVVTGDVTQASEPIPDIEPWYQRPTVSGEPAQRTVWAADALDDYLHGRLIAGARLSESLDGLIRDRLPPLEDLVLIGHPMPLGQGSGVFLIGLVLWGSYRHTIDWRVPIVGGSMAYFALVLLAVPTSISPDGGNWRFLAAARADIGPATALTFSHYIAFASPLIIALGLFASRLETQPLRGGATIVWAATFGVLCAASTLYLSVALGPLITIAFAPAAARLADRWIGHCPMRLPS